MATASRPRPNGAAPREPKPSLRYQRRSLWLSALYLPLLVIPWVITCLMMFRPVRKASYGDHVGTDVFTDEDAREVGQWLMAAKVMSTIATVIGLPVISALLAQATVRYSQRRREGQSLSLAQFFTLANRGWADLRVMLRLGGGQSTSPLLRFGALLVVITLIQPPIQSLMVRYEPSSMATCQDVPTASYDARYIDKPRTESCRRLPVPVERQVQRWYDPDPGDLEQCPQGLVLSRLTSKLSNIRTSDAQTHLWPEEASGYGYPPNERTLWDYKTFSTFTGIRQYNKTWAYYASSLPSGTTTGVLRYHALRQHSAARCENVSQSSFPPACAGSSPFTATFTLLEFTVKICVPGASNQTPWTRSRNRQSVDEELWIDVQMNQTRSARIFGDSFTTHCTSTSTRGYFEPGNQHNGNVPGPLLEKWPDQDTLFTDFNDATGFLVQREHIPSEVASARDGSLGISWDVPVLDPFTTSAWRPTPGPLMTSALALFGNTSFFFTAANATKANYDEVLRSLCRTRVVPFSMFYNRESEFRSPCQVVYYDGSNERYYEQMLLVLVSEFLFQFSDTWVAKTMLDVSMFAANEILLTETANTGGVVFSRAIYSSNGYEILKPVKSIPAIAVVSVLLGLQVIAVVLLVIYNSSFPTWTASLDALVMAKMGTELKDLGLAPLGVHDKREATKLAEAEGVVGLVQADKEVETDRGSETTPVLGLGASGVITRTALSDKETDKV